MANVGRNRNEKFFTDISFVITNNAGIRESNNL